MVDNEQPLRRHRPLLELATRQHGVVSTRQLKSIGYSRSSASKANKVGRLYRVHRGVYAVGRKSLDWHGRCLAAVLASRPALASHTAAARLWGLQTWSPETIHLTVPTKRRPKPGFAVHFALLPDVDIDVIDEIPVTGLPRTLLDLAATSPKAQLGRALERAEELGIFDLGPVDALLGRTGDQPGVTPLRTALALYRDDPTFTRSGLEKSFLAHVLEAGLSRPSMNYIVAEFELDAYWERERFVVELDVFETHGTRAAFERDRVRQDDLQLLGIEMIRVTGPRLKREPEEVMRRLAAHLDRRRRELS